MAAFSKAALQILMAHLLSTQAALGDTQLNEITTHSTAWTKTGQDTGMAATPLDSFQTMKTYPPDNSHPFRLDALTICIIGAVVAVNVGMVFCCARLACLKLTGQDLDPLATEAAQQAHATVLEAGEAGGGPGGGTAAGGPRIEITAVTHPNMEMSVARRLHRRSSQEEQATVQAEVEDPLSASCRGPSDQHTAHLCASAVIKPLECCALPMLTLDIESSGCSAAA